MLLLVGARVIEKYSTNLGTQIKISTVKRGEGQHGSFIIIHKFINIKIELLVINEEFGCHLLNNKIIGNDRN
jgi:hypothetical protein